MDQVVKLVSERVGISEEQARTAVDTVVGFIKQRAPAPLAQQIDGWLSGSGGASAASSAIDAVGGLFGKK